MDRANPYEAAFEAFLRERRVPFLAVDEARRTLFPDASVKSPDFVLFHATGQRILVDVKGRRFPGGPPERPRAVWQNWSTLGDLDGLDRWTAQLGPGTRALLVFAYRLAANVAFEGPAPDVWTHRGCRFLLRGTDVGAYRARMRTRSPRWGTVHLPAAAFREIARPVSEWLAEPG